MWILVVVVANINLYFTFLYLHVLQCWMTLAFFHALRDYNFSTFPLTAIIIILYSGCRFTNRPHFIHGLIISANTTLRHTDWTIKTGYYIHSEESGLNTNSYWQSCFKFAYKFTNIVRHTSATSAHNSIHTE